MKLFSKSSKKDTYFKDLITKKENDGNDFVNEKNDKSMIKLNKLLTKLSDIDNEKVDAIRLVTMYVESSGRDINLPQLISFLKS